MAENFPTDSVASDVIPVDKPRRQRTTGSLWFPRRSESSHPSAPELVKEFRKALGDCEQLYRSAALECARYHPEVTKGSPREFVARMLDLHRGLLVKTFIEVAYVDLCWGGDELLLAGELFDHAWGKRLDAAEAKEALGRLMQEETDLKWGSLVGPFERIALLRNRVAELETLVMRIANMVAKADGEVTPEEVRQLEWIQAELERQLKRVPLDEPGQHGAAHDASRQAVQEMYAEAAGSPRKDTDQRQAVRIRQKPADELLKDVLAELDELIGLDQIKEEVRTLANYLKIEQEREKLGLPTTQISLHMVYTGNPGTGKTSVARLVGRILGAMGILAKGHLIETDRSGLVAEYAGQTGPKTHKRIDESLDGVLFIDEAYSLVAERGDDPYGAEALQALLKRMEDDRNRLVVILAGYPEPMDRLIKSNPGLSSRFNRHLDFPDYTATQLGMIFHSMCGKNRYELPGPVRARLLVGFQHLLDHRDEHFGNGRLVRNVFERAISRLANRVAGIAPLTRELLTTFHPEDIELDSVPAELWATLHSPALRFHLPCPGCQQRLSVAGEHLGKRVQCKRCSQKFRAEWGDLDAALLERAKQAEP